MARIIGAARRAMYVVHCRFLINAFLARARVRQDRPEGIAWLRLKAKRKGKRETGTGKRGRKKGSSVPAV